MKPILSFFITVLILFAHDNGLKHQKAPLKTALPLLQPLTPFAFSIGHGPVKVYAFVDPLCPHSRNFVTLVSENKKLQQKYHYYFLLYTLPRLKSEKMVQALFMSKHPGKDLQTVMVKRTLIKAVAADAKAQKKIDAISDVAQKLDIYKRPYLFLVKPKKAQK